MKNAKMQLGQVAPVFLACLFFVWLWPAAALAQAKGYAVQVAAVRSAPSADEMKNGLCARGLDAYWVKSGDTKRAPLYQVRVGKFTALETALAYAERLLASGLLEAYAVTTFEPPAEPVLPETLQASLEVQEFMLQGPTNDSGALLAAINSRQWWLPVNRQSFTPLSALSQRELLVYALGRHEWRLSNNLNVLLVGGPSLAARANPLLPPTAIPGASPIVNQPAPPVGQFDSAGVAPPTDPSLAEGGTLVRTGVPEINRPSNRPTAERGISYALPPRLQGWVEMMNGRLVMKLRNLDQDRSFAGVARVTLNDERHSAEIAPLQFNLPPDSEQVFPVNEAARDGDSWMLMVFDEGGAMRLLRGASLGQESAPAQPAVASSNPNPVGVAAPPYVTGTYDATNPAPGQSSQRGQGGVISPTSDAPNPAAASGVNNTPEATNSTPAAPPGASGDASGQVTVTPRLIAATTENITIEFDISAPRPLNYISLTLLSGDYRDVRQALMSTPHGRVPFLVPAAQATGAFYYEIKDESGRALFSGTGDFRQLGGGQ